MEVVRTSSFWRDLTSVLDYFDGVHAADVAYKFLGALDQTIQFIHDFPDLGSPWESSRPRRAGLRFQLVKGFENYVVFYRRADPCIHVLRLLYGSQNIEELLEK